MLKENVGILEAALLWKRQSPETSHTLQVLDN